MGETVVRTLTINNDQQKLNQPSSIHLDEESMTMFISDSRKNSVIEWKVNQTDGRLAAGGRGKGLEDGTLQNVTVTTFDTYANRLYMCDRGNRRIMQWALPDSNFGESVRGKVDCWGIAMHNRGFLYIVEDKNHVVKKYRIGHRDGTVVAGGHGKGNGTNQLSGPTYIFVDRDYSVYVSDSENHRVMKWKKDAKEGVVVAWYEIGRAHV